MSARARPLDIRGHHRGLPFGAACRAFNHAWCRLRTGPPEISRALSDYDPDFDRWTLIDTEGQLAAVMTGHRIALLEVNERAELPDQ